MARHRQRCWDLALHESTMMEEHRPHGISAATALPNGVRFTAGMNGEVNAYNPNHLVQFTTKIMLLNNGTERITRLYAWDAWDEHVTTPPPAGPRWFVAIVVTQDPQKWFLPNSSRHTSRLLVWNVKTGMVAPLYSPTEPNSHRSQITALAHYRDLLITAAQDGSILVWNPAFPLAPMVCANDHRYDGEGVVNVLQSMLVIGDNALRTGGSGGPVLVAVLHNCGVLVWNLWEVVRLARQPQHPNEPAKLVTPVATGIVGDEGDTVKDVVVFHTIPATTSAQAYWRVLALVQPAGSAGGRVRHFTVSGFAVNRNFIEIPLDFVSSSRIVVCDYAVAVLGPGLLTVVQQAGSGQRAWDAAVLLEEASKAHTVLDYDNPEAVADSSSSAPRMYRWLDERLTQKTMETTHGVLASTAADGASTTVFVRLMDRVVAFSTELTADGKKRAAVDLPREIVGGNPTFLLAAGYGSDAEEDMLVGDDEGACVIVDTRSLQQPQRLTFVSFFHILPPLLDFLLVTLQISAFSFLQRNRLPWHRSVEFLQSLLRWSILDLDTDIATGFTLQFFVVVLACVASLVAVLWYHLFEVRKPVKASGSARRANTRLDDSCCMSLLWWLSWAANSVLLLPIVRTLMSPMDCDSHPSGHAVWQRDPTAQITDDPRAYVGDNRCFAGMHWLYFWVGLLVLIPFGLMAVRLSPVAGDVSLVDRWFDKYWLWRSGERPFVGAFTRNNVTANVTSFCTVVIKLGLLFFTTVVGRWPGAIAALAALLTLCLIPIGITFPTYESPVMNRALVGGHCLAFWTSLCACLTAMVHDHTVRWPALLLLAGWAIAAVGLLIAAAVAAMGCMRLSGEAREANARASSGGVAASKRILRHGAYAGYVEDDHTSHLVNVTTVANQTRMHETAPLPSLFPFPQVKEWPVLSPWEPSVWAHGMRQAEEVERQKAFAAAEAKQAEDAAAAAAAAAATAQPKPSAKKLNETAQEMWSQRQERKTVDPNDPNLVAAEAAAAIAEHEVNQTSLMGRLQMERQRQKAKALARKRAASAKKRGKTATVNPMEIAKGTETDARQAMEFVYREHDAQINSLKAQLAQERAEQRARLEAKLKAREARAAAAEAKAE